MSEGMKTLKKGGEHTHEDQWNLYTHECVYGVTNRVPFSSSKEKFNASDQFLIFLDYDKVPYAKIVQEAHDLAFVYELGDGVIFQTRPKHYWVVFFNPLSRSTVLDVMCKTSSDFWHFCLFKKHGSTVLRITDKHKFDLSKLKVKTVIRRGTTKRFYSAGHFRLFDLLTNGKLSAIGVRPGETALEKEVEFVKHKTGRKIPKEVLESFNHG